MTQHERRSLPSRNGQKVDTDPCFVLAKINLTPFLSSRNGTAKAWRSAAGEHLAQLRQLALGSGLRSYGDGPLPAARCPTEAHVSSTRRCAWDAKHWSGDALGVHLQMAETRSITTANRRGPDGADDVKT